MRRRSTLEDREDDALAAYVSALPRAMYLEYIEAHPDFRSDRRSPYPDIVYVTRARLVETQGEEAADAYMQGVHLDAAYALRGKDPPPTWGRTAAAYTTLAAQCIVAVPLTAVLYLLTGGGLFAMGMAILWGYVAVSALGAWAIGEPTV